MGECSSVYWFFVPGVGDVRVGVTPLLLVLILHRIAGNFFTRWIPVSVFQILHKHTIGLLPPKSKRNLETDKPLALSSKGLYMVYVY